MKKAVTVSLLACLVQISISALQPAWCANPPNAPPAAMSEEAMGKQVGLLENRFFAHQYANDPMEKRLERLELMVFGGTQEGSNDERFQRLKKTVAERPQQSAKKSAEHSPGTTAKDEAGSSSAQYPILNTLEWRALKKTYANESLDQRLARMEKKLFGADSPTMAYVDRVDRLKRTLGVGVTAMQPSGPTGPAPKARPHSQGDYSSPFFGGGGIFGGGMSPNFGFGDVDGEGMLAPGISRTFSQMFQDMNRQMAEMQKLGPGNWVYDQETGDWVEQGSGRKVHPGPSGNNGTGNGKKKTPGAPGFQQQMKPFVIPRMPHAQPQFPFTVPHKDSEMPPYADPNSI